MRSRGNEGAMLTKVEPTEASSYLCIWSGCLQNH